MLTALVCAALLAPQDPLQALLTLDSIEIHGAHAFAPEEIRASLRRDGETWRMLEHVRGSGTQAGVLARRMEEGYRRAGYADIRVDHAVKDDRITLEVTEGPLFTCGGVRVLGCQAIAKAELETALAAAPASARSRWNGWVAGTPACCDDQSMVEAAAAVQRIYLDHGRHASRATARVQRQGEQLQLVVQVNDEGGEIHVGTLRLDGEREDEREAVLARVAVQPGARYTTAFMVDLRQRLEQLGRYRTIRLPDAGAAVDGMLDPFTVQVVLEPKAPAFAMTRWADLEQLRRARTWLLAAFAHGACVRADAILTKALSWNGMTVGPGRVSFCLGQDGALVASEAVAIASGPSQPGVLIAGKQGIRLSHGRERGVWRFHSHLQVYMAMLPSDAVDSNCEFRWGIGWAERAPADQASSFDFRIADTVLVLLLHGKEPSVTRAGEDLVLHTAAAGDEGLRLHADGSITGHLTPANSDLTWSMSVESRTLAEIEASLLPAPGGKETPLGDFLVARASRLCAASLAQGPEGWRDAAALTAALGRYVQSSIAASAGAEPDRVPFPLPVEESDAADLARSLQVLLHEESAGIDPASWTGTCLLAVPDLAFGTAEARAAAIARVDRLLDAKEPGPIAFLLQAWMLRDFDHAHARQHAQKGLERASFERALADLRTVAPENGRAAAWLQGLGACWRAQPELKEIFAGIAQEGAARDRAAFELGLHRLWDAALQQVVVSMLESLAR